MKRNTFFLMMLCGLLVAIAWSSPARAQQGGGSAEKSAVAGQQKESPSKTAAREPGSQTSRKEDREDFEKDVKKTLHDLDRKIAALGKQVKKQASKAEAGAKESWQDLKAKQKAAKKKAEELRTASEEAWEKVKGETNTALEEARKAYEKAAAYFK